MPPRPNSRSIRYRPASGWRGSNTARVRPAESAIGAILPQRRRWSEAWRPGLRAQSELLGRWSVAGAGDVFGVPLIALGVHLLDRSMFVDTRGKPARMQAAGGFREVAQRAVQCRIARRPPGRVGHVLD